MTATDSGKRVQCSGIAKSTGKRCRRLVQVDYVTSTAYCHQHQHQQKEASNTGAQSTDLRKDGNSTIPNKTRKNIKDDTVDSKQDCKPKKASAISKFWLKLFCHSVDERSFSQSHDLRVNLTRQISVLSTRNYKPVSQDVRAKYADLLARELKKPMSSADSTGYIYIYELAINTTDRANIDPDTVLFLKIGRAQNVAKRIDQWKVQCSHAVILTGHFPTPTGGHRCVATHKAERLIHLELRSMFPCSADNAAVRPLKPSQPSEFGICAVCGKRHLEWFAVRKRDAHIVVRVISKWVEYVGMI
ncbi:hypothetical protein V1512DRAFT_245133 [Lipomyces arxii]|uniref:uncharacterized protein n=1 Tax=Lipomyces arxii TaxID=56418 RepID=UPI0034CD9DDE